MTLAAAAAPALSTASRRPLLRQIPKICMVTLLIRTPGGGEEAVVEKEEMDGEEERWGQENGGEGGWKELCSDKTILGCLRRT